MTNPAAYRNKREPKLVRRDPPHPDATDLWEPLYTLKDAALMRRPDSSMAYQEGYAAGIGAGLIKPNAQFVLQSLEELVADPQIDFGPAFEGARTRQAKAIRIMRDYVKTLVQN